MTFRSSLSDKLKKLNLDDDDDDVEDSLVIGIDFGTTYKRSNKDSSPGNIKQRTDFYLVVGSLEWPGRQESTLRTIKSTLLLPGPAMAVRRAKSRRSFGTMTTMG
jgi:hypothetical protein